MSVRHDTVVNHTNSSTLYAFAEKLEKRAEEMHDESTWWDGVKGDNLYREAKLMAGAAQDIKDACEKLRKASDEAYDRLYDRLGE